MKAKLVDVIVAGSGSAGMTTAVVAAKLGLDVLLVEKTRYFGGTTALSGGGAWIPNNHQMDSMGASDTADAAMLYLEAVVGNWLRQDLAQAFLAQGPEMMDFMLANTAVQMIVRHGPDYFPDRPGGSQGGRAFTPVLFDGRELGSDLSRLRPPLEQFNSPWGMMINMADIQHAMAAKRSPKSAWYMAKLFAQYGVERMRYGRGARLTMGNALAGRLLKSALDAGVELWSESPIVDLVKEGGRVAGAVIEHDGVNLRVLARRGVVLATGGFSASEEMRRKYYASAERTMTLVPPGNTGDGIALAQRAGAAMVERNADNGVWIMMSRYTKPDGSVMPIPRILNFGRPGVILVDRNGQRFANEATLFVAQKMREIGLPSGWAICDHRFVRKWGLGNILPTGIRLRRMVRQGYVQRAPTLEMLARQIGIDPAGLGATIAATNAAAREGRGDQMGKGEGGFDRYLGDPANKPHPNLGAIESGPFYALEVFPGDITSTLGLQVSASGRVLAVTGVPIDGLFACGLDMNSIWSGLAPANGANNGANMTFGYIIARTLAEEAPRPVGMAVA
ncbi:FAD-dependent oxidoreductase [Sphingomonas sp.]|uniref:FAD-dependent oxidoreductase n=1 Tax=Sphingomonas sp. TaxID=28214 RepID=UPI0025E760EF|nr:FAD-dependent oxidoreductase [Sphingomonas sp.]